MLYVSRWERRDGADWDAVVAAAAAWSDAVEASTSVRSAHTYGAEGHVVVVIVDTDSLDAVTGHADPAVARADAGLACVARHLGTEIWSPIAPAVTGVPARTLRETLDLA